MGCGIELQPGGSGGHSKGARALFCMRLGFVVLCIAGLDGTTALTHHLA